MAYLMLAAVLRLSALCRPFMPEYKYVMLRDQALDILFPGPRLYKQVRQYEQRYAKAFHDYLERLDAAGREKALAALKRGMDEESGNAIDRFLAFYGLIYRQPGLPHHERYDLSMRDEVARINSELARLQKELKTPPHIGLEYRMDCFYFLSGLRFVPPGVVERCAAGRDVLDCGAFNGDTAIMFSKLTKARRIYAFEPDRSNFSALTGTLAEYPLENVVPLPFGVGEASRAACLHAEGASSFVEAESAGGERIEMRDIDSFVVERAAAPGIIKMDIEGYELNAVKGALKTIKKHRPILLIALYHSPNDFFGIKPLLERNVEGYTFMVRHLVFSHAAFETYLIAYPNR